MYKAKVLKKSLNYSEKSQLIRLSKGFQTLNVTRWIYFSVIIIANIGNILGKIFLGSFYSWLFPTTGNSGDVPMGLFLFGFVILSFPRIIGNIIYIKELRNTSRLFKDYYFQQAYKRQVYRITCYFFIIAFLIGIISNVLGALDQYYIENHIYGNLGEIIKDLNQIHELEFNNGDGLISPSLIALIVFCCIFIFIEKIVNVLSWISLQNWFKLQKNIDKNKTFAEKINMGLNSIKMGTLINFFESIFGNLFYNLGLRNMVLAFNDFSGEEIIIMPNQRDYYYAVSTTPEIPISREIPSTQQRIQHSYTAPPKTQISEAKTTIVQSNKVQFCGYCGNKLKYENARFCPECGNQVN